MRGAVVSMEVAVVGFPGVEPSDKFLIEAIEELLPVVSAFFTWKAGEECQNLDFGKVGTICH